MIRSLAGEQVTRVVKAAGAAPSIHNTQPWRFTVRGPELWLAATPERALPVADPAARALYISCGAALFNAELALRMLACDPAVRLLPHPEYPLDVLAVIRASAGRPPEVAERERYEAIWLRHTDRGPFSDRQIPPGVFARLQDDAQREGAHLRQLDGQQTSVVLAMARQAGRELAAHAEHQEELRQWLGTGSSDGIPPWALPRQPARIPSPVRDADLLGAAPAGERPSAHYERRPQLAVLTTTQDEPEDWLMAGKALQRLLLTATRCGLSASFLYHLIEQDDMRGDANRWPWPGRPQMVVRLGYGSSTRPAPRRDASQLMRAGPDRRAG